MNQTQTDTRPHVLYHCENLILRLGLSIYWQVLHFCEFVGFVGNLICIQQTFSTNIVFANIIKHILNLVRVPTSTTAVVLDLASTAVGTRAIKFSIRIRFMRLQNLARLQLRRHSCIRLEYRMHVY